MSYIKTKLSGLIILSILLFMWIAPLYASEKISIVVDQKTVQFENTPVVIEGRVFISVRDMAKHLGATIHFEPSTKTITLTKEKTKVILQIGSSTAMVNTQKVSMDAAPMITNGVTLVPLKAAYYTFGATTEWKNNTIYINSDGTAVVIEEDPKLYIKKTTVTLGSKNTTLSYISIPASSKLKADIAIAQNSIGQTEELKSLAQRSYALAAINGSYYQNFDESKPMEPYGLLIKNGRLIHQSGVGSSIGFTSSGQVKMDIISTSVEAIIGETKIPVNYLNHTPTKDSDTVTIYTSERGTTTNINYGINIIVKNNEVLDIVANQSVNIPASGFVLHFANTNTTFVNSIKKGQSIEYKVSYLNSDNKTIDWSDVTTAIGAGPLLLKNGTVVLEPSKEGFADDKSFTLSIFRSAVGVTKDNSILLVAGVNCTLEQLATLMSQLGAIDAISMDSGSFSGSYANDGCIVTPSKEISNALIFK